VDSFRPLDATLIWFEPRAGAACPTRLLRCELPPGASEWAVRVTRLSSAACTVAGTEGLPGETPFAWLRFHGREPLRCLVAVTGADELRCEFTQPLYPAELQQLLAGAQQPIVRTPAVRARCSFLRS